MEPENETARTLASNRSALHTINYVCGLGDEANLSAINLCPS